MVSIIIHLYNKEFAIEQTLFSVKNRRIVILK